MTLQQTSLDAYADLLKQGLGAKQQAVFRAIKELGQASNLDIAHQLRWSINRVTPRTNELVKMGKVTMAKKDISKYTGKKVIYWTTTV